MSETTYHWDLKIEKKYENFVFIEKFYNLEQTNAIISAGLNSKLSDMSKGTVGTDLGENIVKTDIRQSTISWIKSSEPANDWIYRSLTEAVVKINDMFFNFDLKSIQSLQFSIYDSKENDFYTKHIDISNLFPFECMRKLSFTVQLSDPNTYEGGELILHYSGKPAKIAKNLGSIFFFPSYTLHEVTPVTKGIRYSLVGWVIGPRFK
jgi:PKHD-type hydroxylase